MSCENPLRIPNPRYDEDNIQDYEQFFWNEYGRTSIPDKYIDVPCGKCYSCQRSRLNGWRIRLLAEYERYPNSVFITLTFDERYIVEFENNPNRAVRLFLDRCRKYYGSGLRHFIIGEYGDTTGRFHYHGIIFNTPPGGLEYDVFRRLWKYGHIFLGYCKRKTIDYVVKYITKDPKDDRVPPRLIVSKGLGSCYVQKYGADHFRRARPYIVYKGKYRVPLPTYLRNKIFDEKARFDLAEISRLEPFERIVDGVKYFDYFSYRDALRCYHRKQISAGLSPNPKVARKRSKRRRSFKSKLDPAEWRMNQNFGDPKFKFNEHLVDSFIVTSDPF